jgi:predicted AlkP superfamily phosphohydrolase/phosphomutase
VAALYQVDPAREGYPDLIALPDDPYWVRTKLADRTRPYSGHGWVEPDPNLPGTHRPEGIVALAAAGITPGRTLQAHLIDIAPTILTLLGHPIPASMEGRPLSCVSAAPAFRTDSPAPAINGPHQPGFEYTPEEQAIIEERLADLGYLE